MSTLSDVIDLVKKTINDLNKNSRGIDLDTLDANSNLHSSGCDHHTLQHECMEKFKIIIPWTDDPDDEQPDWREGTIQTVVDSVDALK